MSPNRYGWLGSIGILVIYAIAFQSTRLVELADGTRHGAATMADNRALWMVLLFVGVYCLGHLAGATRLGGTWVAVAVVAAVTFSGFGPDVRGDYQGDSRIHATFDGHEDRLDGLLERVGL